MFGALLRKLKTKSRGELISLIDKKIGLGRLEMIFSSNWFNPFATFYLNLRSFPFKTAIRMPISVYGRPHFLCLTGSMQIEGNPKRGMIKFNKSRLGAPQNGRVQTEINNCGKIIFKGGGVIGTGNRIVVGEIGCLEIGDDFVIADNINFGVHNRMIIGKHSRIAHRTQFFDTNYHFIENLVTGKVARYSSEVVIGEGVWICNSSTITHGSFVPDGSVVASNSLVNKDFSEEGSNLLLGGSPAKVLTKGIARIIDGHKNLVLSEYFKNHPDRNSVIYSSIENNG